MPESHGEYLCAASLSVMCYSSCWQFLW